MKISGEIAKYKSKKTSMLLIVIIFIFAQIWVLGSFIYIIRPNLFYKLAIPFPIWVKWLGLVLTLLGINIEFLSQLYLGRNYSTFGHIREEQSLITTGPYRYVRHPMYTALITIGIGLPLLSANWYLGLPFIAKFIIIVPRIKNEEKGLVEKLGDEYIRYMEKTKLFIPFLI